MKLEISVCDISFIIVVVFIHRFFLFFKVQWKIIWRKVAPLLNIESKKFLIFSLLAPIKSFLFTNYTSFDPLLISPCRRLKYILIIKDRKFRSRLKMSRPFSSPNSLADFWWLTSKTAFSLWKQRNRTVQSILPIERMFDSIFSFSPEEKDRNKWSKEIRLLCEKSGNAPRFSGVISDFSILNMPFRGGGRHIFFSYRCRPELCEKR